MKDFWSNYRQTLLLLGGIIIGGSLGFFVPAAAPYLKPVGEVFMNLLFVLIVPLVFFSVSNSVASLTRRSMLGKMFGVSASVWILMLLVASTVTYLTTLVVNPIETGADLMADGVELAPSQAQNIGELIVNTLTVSDFQDLYSIRHILPLMLVAVLMGIAAAKLKTNAVCEFFENANELTGKALELLMVVGPVGLGCYFAAVAADMGGMLVVGYGRMLLTYCVLTLLFFGIVHPLIAWFSIGNGGMKGYWKTVLTPTVTAVSSLSSSACMPANMTACKQLGVQPDVAEATIPIGTHLFKFGSGVACSFKVMFVFLLTGQSIADPTSACVIIGLAILASMVVGAVPTGAGTAELLICSIVGADPRMVGLIMVISTLVDMPATLLNVNGNMTATLLINKVVGRPSPAPP
ncbi:MAG: cation:dicarboxylase symporter family transporter [Paludibacteraceae bacterium]|nr:cation:dicarboxylase symporter family transporter [Paludibacteraceae bacterium]